MIKNNDYSLINEANQKLCLMAREETKKVLKQVLDISSERMINGYNRSDN